MTIKEKILNTNVDQIGVCNRYVDGDVIVWCSPSGPAIGLLTGQKYDTRWSCANDDFAFPEKYMRLATQEEKELLGDEFHIYLNDIPEPTITLNKCEYDKMCSKLNDQTIELVGENTKLQIKVNCLNGKITQMKDVGEELAKDITGLYGLLLEANVRIEELEEEVRKEQELARTAELLSLRVLELNVENVELSNKLNTISYFKKRQ